MIAHLKDISSRNLTINLPLEFDTQDFCERAAP